MNKWDILPPIERGVERPKHVKLRALTKEEAVEIKRLAASRTEPMRSVQRAKIIAALADDPTVNASEAGLQAGYRSPQVGPQWVKRFNWKKRPQEQFGLLGGYDVIHS